MKILKKLFIKDHYSSQQKRFQNGLCQLSKLKPFELFIVAYFKTQHNTFQLTPKCNMSQRVQPITNQLMPKTGYPDQFLFIKQKAKPTCSTRVKSTLQSCFLQRKLPLNAQCQQDANVLQKLSSKKLKALGSNYLTSSVSKKIDNLHQERQSHRCM